MPTVCRSQSASSSRICSITSMFIFLFCLCLRVFSIRVNIFPWSHYSSDFCWYCQQNCSRIPRRFHHHRYQGFLILGDCSFSAQYFFSSFLMFRSSLSIFSPEFGCLVLTWKVSYESMNTNKTIVEECSNWIACVGWMAQDLEFACNSFLISFQLLARVNLNCIVRNIK